MSEAFLIFLEHPNRELNRKIALRSTDPFAHKKNQYKSVV